MKLRLWTALPKLDRLSGDARKAPPAERFRELPLRVAPSTLLPDLLPESSAGVTRRLLAVPSLWLLAAVVMPIFCGCHPAPEVKELDDDRIWNSSEVAEALNSNDPWEGFNRSMFAVNKFGVLYIVRPVGWIYGSIMPRPFIKHIGMASRNLEFPGRMFSALCQAKWKDSGVVFLRFLTNSTIGIGGLFDPAEAWFGLYPREETFGQAFECWGIGPGYTFVLPLCSGTNVRDSVGMLFDKAFDIKTYLPYGASTFAGVNQAVGGYRPLQRQLRANQDAYQMYKEFDLVNRRLLQEDWALKMRLALEERLKNPLPLPVEEKRDFSAFRSKVIHLEDFRSENVYSDSVRALMFKPQHDETSFWSQLSIWNTDFTEKAEERTIPASRENADGLEYSFWRSPLKDKYNSAPMVFIIPGIGTHHTGTTAVALAEMLNHQGYAVAVLSSSFCWDFYNSRHTGALPGYTPDDARMVRLAMIDILKELNSGKESKRFVPSEVNVVGYSMGGLQAVHIAGLEERENLLNVRRFVAVNPPVDMLNALKAVDECGRIARGWSAGKMKEVFPDGFGKAMMISSYIQPHVEPLKPVDGAGVEEPPQHNGFDYRTGLSEEQAKLLTAVSFRYTLRDLLMQAVRDKRTEYAAGIGEYKWNRRTALYKQIDRVTFNEYMHKWLMPTLPEKMSVDKLRESTGLRCMENTLKNNGKVRILHNVNDFLLTESDREWLDRIMPERLTWFDNGGHLGNLYYGIVHRAIIGFLK